MQEFENSLPMLLYRALDVIMPRFRRIFTEFGMTETQWRVLRVLWEHSPITFSDLSNATLIPAPSLVGVLDRLADQDLILRSRSEADRRQVYIAATSEGRRIEKQVSPRIENAYQELRNSLDARTWQQLTSSLGQLSMLSIEAARVPAKRGRKRKP